MAAITLIAGIRVGLRTDLSSKRSIVWQGACTCHAISTARRANGLQNANGTIFASFFKQRALSGRV